MPKTAYFHKAEEIKELAFKAMHGITLAKAPKNARVRIKAYNRIKAKAFGEAIETQLHKLSKQFAKIDLMNPFYLDLMGAIVNIERLKKNLSFVSTSSRLVKRLRYNSVKKIYTATTDSGANAGLAEFIARACSVLKKLDRPLRELKEDSKKMIELPSIEFQTPTIVLAGYPNVGKTTLLFRLTGAKAEIAAYAFTTKAINSGFFELKYQRVQVLDTPGLLDREKRNEIERKAIAALRHLAEVIVFVADPTTHSGYSLAEQAGLYRQIKEDFAGKKILVVLNKSELATPQEIEAAQMEFGGVILEGNDSNGRNLVEGIGRAMK